VTGGWALEDGNVDAIRRLIEATRIRLSAGHNEWCSMNGYDPCDCGAAELAESVAPFLADDDIDGDSERG
jgi:hypothetical protein